MTEAMAEKTICIPINSDQSNCPITSFAFTLMDMPTMEANKYKKAKTLDPKSKLKFYYSKSV